MNDARLAWSYSYISSPFRMMLRSPFVIELGVDWGHDTIVRFLIFKELITIFI